MSRVEISQTGRNRVKRLALPYLVEAAQQIADAANSQSSWAAAGGMEKSPAGYVAQRRRRMAAVVALSHSAQIDNARNQRILRNVKKGRLR